MTERLHFDFSLSCIGEGNGNPLQCSCLENPRDRGAWWAAVYGVAQSQTRLKRLSSSSSKELSDLTFAISTFQDVSGWRVPTALCLAPGWSCVGRRVWAVLEAPGGGHLPLHGASLKQDSPTCCFARPHDCRQPQHWKWAQPFDSLAWRLTTMTQKPAFWEPP